MTSLTLVSHQLCPYVQRAAIALAEKGVAYERAYVDLANKPDWFKALSPLGKTPVLQVEETSIFESAVILEYLEDTQPNPLHPADALRRAEHRSLIEFGSAILNDIWALYSAPDAIAFDVKKQQLAARFAWLERRLVAEPWFDGAAFSLVDAVFAPVFRYFDAFDRIADFGILAGLERMARWRGSLAVRDSVKIAVAADYDERLRHFLLARGSHLSRLMEEKAAA
ncbi:glutathione S-transferase family protein [Dongia sp. agr-C8]